MIYFKEWNHGLQCNKDKEEGEVGASRHLKVVVEDGGVPNDDAHHEGQETGHKCSQKISVTGPSV